MSESGRRTPVNTVDRVAFRDMCAAFARREVAPRWEQADREKIFPRDFYVACAKAGLIGITADESVGGHGLGAYEEAIAMEELSRINPNLAVSVLVQNVAGSILYEYGTDAQRAIARQVIAGECMVAITVTEPEAGNDIQNVRTSAQRQGDEWVLDGLKSFITLAASADVLITLAQTDRGQGRRGMQFFAVPRNTPGVVVTPIETYVNRPAPTCRVAFNQVRVPDSARIPAASYRGSHSADAPTTATDQPWRCAWSRNAAASSSEVIWKEPSPSISQTGRPLPPTAAPMAAGRP